MDRSGGKPPGDHVFSRQVLLSGGEFGFKHLAAAFAHGVELLIFMIMRQPAGGKSIQEANTVGHPNLLQSRENAIDRDRINVPAGLQNPISDGRDREGLHTFVERLQD